VSGGDGAAMLGIQRLIADAVADMLPTGEPVLAPSQQDPRNAPRCPIAMIATRYRNPGASVYT
jgi:hypothetical protein